MTDSEIYVTLEQIAKHVKRSVTQVRMHAAKGWLKCVSKRPGIRGRRFTLQSANRWIALHHPTAGPIKSPFQDVD